MSVTTGGAENVPVSIAEDILATILSILPIVIPVAVAALIVLLTAFVIWMLWRRARRITQAPSACRLSGPLLTRTRQHLYKISQADLVELHEIEGQACPFRRRLDAGHEIATSTSTILERVRIPASRRELGSSGRC